LKTTPEKLSAALKRGLAPVYLLSGEEPLTQGEAADAIRAAARGAGFTEREVFFVERANAGPWEQIFASTQALSLFAARRLIEVRIPAGKPGTDGAQALAELAGLAGADVLLLVITGGLDWTTQKSSWVRALDEAGVWVDAAPVRAAQFGDWLRARAVAAGVQLEDEAVALLAQQCEGNLLAAVQELQKLSLAGITRAGAAEIMAGSSQSSRFDVAQLGAAVLCGELPRALRILAGLKAEDIEPTLVLWSLWQELRAVWLQLVPGAPLPGVWSRNREHLATAAARFKPLGRACFARLDVRMARVDRIVKGREPGNAWNELGLLVAEFAGTRPLLHEGTAAA